jgi:hypothetical protein
MRTKTIIFALANARTGTLFLHQLFRANVIGCDSRHEPYTDWGNPTLFGRAIDDASAGRLDRIRLLLAKKRSHIEGLPGSVYVETSHAFLKSSYVAALEFFPGMRLIHPVRDPFKCIKSDAYREQWMARLHLPFYFYKGSDGARHFSWALTGREGIFRTFDLPRLTLLQRYLIQWIEIENRAMRFLEEHGLQERCFTLQSPRDLNDASRIQEMFRFFQVQTRYATPRLSGRKNKNVGNRNELTADEEAACTSVLTRIAPEHLRIFDREPYAGCDWMPRFRRCAGS